MKKEPKREKRNCLSDLNELSMILDLVQAQLDGTKHYKDKKGNRLTLYPDCSYDIEKKER